MSFPLSDGARAIGGMIAGRMQEARTKRKSAQPVAEIVQCGLVFVTHCSYKG
jgi:hypothetical protein